MSDYLALAERLDGCQTDHAGTWEACQEAAAALRSAHAEITSSDDALRVWRGRTERAEAEIEQVRMHDQATGIQWQAQYERANKAEAEVERLRTANIKLMDAMASAEDEIDRLRTLLREALRKIRDGNPDLCDRINAELGDKHE